MAKRNGLGTLTLNVTPDGEATFATKVAIVLDRKTQDIRLKIESHPSPFRLLLKPSRKYRIDFPGAENLSCFFSRFRSEKGCLELAPSRTPIVVDKGLEISHLRAGVINFGKNEFLGLPGKKLVLTYSGWTAELTP